MQPKAALWLVAALVGSGCAHHPAGSRADLEPRQVAEAPAQPAAVPAPNGAAAQPGGEGQPAEDVVRALSPFADREAAVRVPPFEPIVIPRDTSIRVRLERAVGTGSNRPGDRFTATLDAPILHGAHVAIPKGTVFAGHLTAAKPSGRLRGRGYLGFTLDSFELDGGRYRIATSATGRGSAGHKRRNLGIIGNGSGLGALIGAIAGGAKGTLIGLGAGAAAGTARAAITGRRNVRLPAETLLSFSLARPVTL